MYFDRPGKENSTPKCFERLQRDKTTKVTEDHSCHQLVRTTSIPKRWRESLLNCRNCKRNLVILISNCMLNNIQGCLQETQALYIAGGFNDPISETVWFVRGKNKPQPNPVYTCNAEEADTRVWLHATRTQHQILIPITLELPYKQISTFWFKLVLFLLVK